MGLFCSCLESIEIQKKFEWRDLKELTPKEFSILKNIKLENTKQFSFEGLQFYAKVLTTHNGDNCRVCFFYKDEMIQILCKMNGYFCKENTKKIANKRLSELILNKIVKIKCGKNDIYGRTFIDVYINDPQGGSQLHVNYLMVSEKITSTEQKNESQQNFASKELSSFSEIMTASDRKIFFD